MSTRANIIIKDNFGSLWFYRHCDGYPKGTLPTLKKYMQWIKEGKIRNNLPQSCGWLIIIGAEEYKEKQIFERFPHKYTKEQEKEWENKISSIPKYDWEVGSYVPTTGEHGDIDYLYELDLNNLSIKVMTPDRKVIEIIKDFNN